MLFKRVDLPRLSLQAGQPCWSPRELFTQGSLAAQRPGCSVSQIPGSQDSCTAGGSFEKELNGGLLEHLRVPYRLNCLTAGQFRPMREEVFPMNSARLTKTVDLLKQVRSEMHDDVDARVTDGLDEAISILEEALTADPKPARAAAALAKLGEALKYLPVIKALFEDFL